MIVSRNLISLSLNIGNDKYHMEQVICIDMDVFYIYKNDDVCHVFTNLCDAARFLVDKWEEVNK